MIGFTFTLKKDPALTDCNYCGAMGESRSLSPASSGKKPSSKGRNWGNKNGTSSTGSRRTLREDSAASKRARHRLKHHSIEEFGRQFAVYPKTLSFNEARGVMGTAYAGDNGNHGGNALTRWMMAPLNLSEEDVLDVCKCSLGFPIHDAIAHGAVLFGIRDEETQDIQSCLVFREYNPALAGTKGRLRRFMDLLSHTCAYVKMKNDSSGLPLLYTDRRKRRSLGDYVARSEHLEEKLTEWHRRYGPSETHWYLSDVGVVPALQGKGYGTEMMMALSKLADRYAMPIYMEAFDEETSEFFSKFGFEKVGTEEVRANEQGSAPMWAKLMVRKVQIEIEHDE